MVFDSNPKPSNEEYIALFKKKSLFEFQFIYIIKGLKN